MGRRAALLVLLASLSAGAQGSLTVDQVVSFVRSSVKLKHPDKQIADYLRGVKLRYRLSESDVVELQAAGAGPRTVEALRALLEASKALPETPSVASAAPQPPPEIPPPSAAQWKKLIADTRTYALSYTRQLPDFICTQVTRRYVDPSGLEFWQSQDVITARLSYFEQKGDYKLTLVNGRYTDAPYQSVGGAISTGEFGSMMREIFDPDTQAVFTWERWATLRGRRTHVIAYRVAQEYSKWQVDYRHQEQITPAYRGLVYVDAENGAVARITLEAQDIPPAFPIQQVSSVLDYDLATIEERGFMLPLRAVMRMREGRLLAKNEVEFRLYRKFSAEASISYDTPEPLSEDKTAEQPPKP